MGHDITVFFVNGDRVRVCDACRELQNIPYCDDCGNYGDCTCRDERIHEYNWKPTSVFFETPRDRQTKGKQHPPEPLFFGFELEVQLYDADEERCLDVVDIPELYVKHDGSLTDGPGFEIVSHPMSWHYLMENRHRFAALWRKLIHLGARSYDTPTCGLHIHHSRRGYSKLQLYRVQKLVCGYSEFTLKVSQRQRARLDEYASLTAEATSTYVRKAAWGQNQRLDGHSRRVAVNLENPDTVEFRLFRGTLSPSGFFKALEYVQALYEFTRNSSNDECTEAQFTQYVQHHARRFPCLAYFLKHKTNMSEALFAALGRNPKGVLPIKELQAA